MTKGELWPGIRAGLSPFLIYVKDPVAHECFQEIEETIAVFQRNLCEPQDISPGCKDWVDVRLFLGRWWCAHHDLSWPTIYRLIKEAQHLNE